MKEQSWTIICNPREVEELRHKLSRNDRNLFSKPPSVSHKHGFPTAVINCTIADSNNITRVRESAEFIRRRIDYPFAMLCFETDLNTRKRRNSYLHTYDGELYADNGEELEFVPLDLSEAPIERTVLVSAQAPLYSGPLPSEVTDQEYLFVPSTEEGISNMMKENGGKWMLFTSRTNMAKHDDIFLAMVSLYEKGILVGLRAATGMPNEEEKHQKSWGFGNARDGVLISCYTANSEDMDDVLKAAKAIRSAIHYDRIINYKTNSASIAGRYHHKGKFHVTKYMHTVHGGFYERDEFNRFELVDSFTNRT